MCRLGVSMVLSPSEGCFSISILSVVLHELICSTLEHSVEFRRLVDLVWQLFFLAGFILAR